MTNNENPGWVTKEQLSTYLKYNVTYAQHNMLVDVFGKDSDAIIRAVKNFSRRGSFNAYLFYDTHVRSGV